MTWWISQRRSENAAWSMRMDQAMPPSPGGTPGGPSWSTKLGCTTSASAATSPRGKISPRVRRAIALMSWEMRCSIECSCLLVVTAALVGPSSAVTERGPQRLQKRFRSLHHHEVAGVLDHVQRPAVADAGLSGDPAAHDDEIVAATVHGLHGWVAPVRSVTLQVRR